MNLEKLKNEWQELGYNLELKGSDTLKPVAHVKANDVLITITTDDVKILTLSLIPWNDKLNNLINTTRQYLNRKKLQVIADKLKANFYTKNFDDRKTHFFLDVANHTFDFTVDKFELYDRTITPETVKTINKIAKVLDWEVEE